MKKLILLALVALSSLAAEAQTKNYGKFDFELGVTYPIAAHNIDGFTNSGTLPYISIEGRRQLNNHPMDLGVQISMSVVNRRVDNNSSYYKYNPYRAVPILVVSDYQFGRGKKVNPYAGLGVGVSMNVITYEIGRNDIDFAFAPRLGVRLFKFLNVSTCYYMTGNEYSRLNFNLGVYF